MLHKVSDFCKKIESIKNISDKLYHLKYNTPKSSERDAEINYLKKLTLLRILAQSTFPLCLKKLKNSHL